MLPNASLKSIIDEEISLEGLEGSTLNCKYSGAFFPPQWPHMLSECFSSMFSQRYGITSRYG